MCFFFSLSLSSFFSPARLLFVQIAINSAILRNALSINLSWRKSGMGEITDAYAHTYTRCMIFVSSCYRFITKSYCKNTHQASHLSHVYTEIRNGTFRVSTSAASLPPSPHAFFLASFSLVGHFGLCALAQSLALIGHDKRKREKRHGVCRQIDKSRLRSRPTKLRVRLVIYTSVCTIHVCVCIYLYTESPTGSYQ